MRGYFVTGTDTGVGKTVVSAWLMEKLSAAYWKPVQSGAAPGEEGDLEMVRRLTALPGEFFHDSVYRLALPRSPHEAAEREGVQIDLQRLHLPQESRCLIVEGAGGVLVPLNDKQLQIDLMVQLALPVIVVARTQLGTINHTLLSVHCLRHYGLEVAGVILNGPTDAENRRAIAQYGQVKILAELPWLQPFSWSQFMRVELSLS
ncbi:dethiobiotin synthase [Candidatus Magnetaquicoccus inordinatus]|uniref:dethiobiotin synthase n=1 Tax=Candidatus Magnetaquicoccus inordinatus TaxID=2496818 RepID=UPI00102B227F|nr:dethiobiotin synthase [Candidatus Magnetaquicoccus inordinatus]